MPCPTPRTTRRAPGLTALFTLALAAPFAACDKSTDDDDFVRRLIQDSIDEENRGIDVVCDCWDEAGFESRGDCTEDQILPAQQRCIEDAFLRDAEASKLYLECIVPLQQELTSCLNRKLECNEPDQADPCFADFDLGAKECIELPNSVQRGLNDCRPGGVATGGGGSASTPGDDDDADTAGTGDTGGPAPEDTWGDTGGSGGEGGATTAPGWGSEGGTSVGFPEGDSGGGVTGGATATGGFPGDDGPWTSGTSGAEEEGGEEGGEPGDGPAPPGR